ncbi:MKRN2 opposite strand protein [Eumeta japonica]|uniref:MKRN2 opposite strand protein n=1 Tax=Eumeta variegata TaxID=151549 RepID=A0A4C1VI54_EUMVA|nr:MKRN2 opposite strand protein [Eumeta japonica]
MSFLSSAKHDPQGRSGEDDYNKRTIDSRVANECLSLPKQRKTKRRTPLGCNRVPYPFVKASQHPRAIVIKPTHGDFLNGLVVEFSEKGICGFDAEKNSWCSRESSPDWDQCLMLEEFDELWNEIWDSILEKVSMSPIWKSECYNEASHNCFTFVLAFLRALDCGELSEKAKDPKLFCKQYVVPRTSAAGKYISLYRQLKRQNYFVQNQ